MSFYEFKRRLCNIVKKLEKKLKETNISVMLYILAHVRMENEQLIIRILI